MSLKYLWNKIFCYLIRKSFQNDDEWRLFYCESTLGYRVIEDFDLCKLDDFILGTGTLIFCKVYGDTVQNNKL